MTLTRRSLLRAAPFAILSKAAFGRSMFSGHGVFVPRPPLPTNFSLGSIFRYNSGYPTKYNSGDGYLPTWADDGNLYIVCDDAYYPFQNSSGQGSNFNVSRLDGYTTSLTGTLVNTMLQFGSTSQGSGSGGNWKSQGCLSIGTKLYLSAHLDNASFTTFAQQSQVIKSSDHGATWTPLPPSQAQPFASPMFSGIGMQAWVNYGQAYAGTGPDNSSNFAYAYFNTLAGPAIGRVSLANIDNLVGTDWSWWKGGDGTVSGNWSSNVSDAIAMTFPAGGNGGFLSTQYIPGWPCYIMVVSFWTNGSSDPNHTYMNIWASAHPWGPWSQVGAQNFDTSSLGALYAMSIAPSSVAVDGGINTMMMSGGNFSNTSPPNTAEYCLHLLPLTIS
jgi:hypothetical protein